MHNSNGARAGRIAPLGIVLNQSRRTTENSALVVDTLLWNGGLVGGIDMGSGTDRATFQNLTQTHLRGILVNGGPGAGDTLMVPG